MTAVTYILYFVLLIGVLVFIHEGGHFMMAKLFKVKVHVFCLGFGPKLVGFRRGETEYKIAAIPVGGYVKMLGEDPTEKVVPEDRGRAFTDKPLWQRFLIIAGGPAMNLVFPLFLHFGVGLTIDQVLPSSVGFVAEGSPAAQAGILPGDEILAIAGMPVQTFDDLVAQVTPNPGVPLEFEISRDAKIMKFTVAPEPTQVPVIRGMNEVTQTIGRVGVGPAFMAPVVAISDVNGAAAAAGIATFDKVVSVEGTAIDKMIALEKELISRRGTAVRLSVTRKRDGVKPPFENFFEETPIELVLHVPASAGGLSDLGLEDTSDVLAFVDPEGVAAEAGMRPGDRLTTLDGNTASLGKIFRTIQIAPDKERIVGWVREGQQMSAAYKPRFIAAGEGKDLGIERDAYDFGIWGYAPSVDPTPIANPARLSSALRYSLEMTEEGFQIIFVGFKLLASGKISLRSIGGPIMIGQLAGMAGEAGAMSFLWMMALISLNLGLLNLLPIPVMDGGHIVFITIEAIVRRPLSLAVKEKTMLVGLAMLVVLMVFATWNDIERLFVG